MTHFDSRTVLSTTGGTYFEVLDRNPPLKHNPLEKACLDEAANHKVDQTKMTLYFRMKSALARLPESIITSHRIETRDV